MGTPFLKRRETLQNAEKIENTKENECALYVYKVATYIKICSYQPDRQQLSPKHGIDRHSVPLLSLPFQ